MSDKAECPGCNSYTSAIRSAFRDGLDCPYCHLPAEVADAVAQARRRGADQALIDRALAAEKRAVAAEREVAEARHRLNRVRAALEDKWQPIGDLFT